MKSLVIGVLALQGAFAKHAEALQSLGAQVVQVRKPADLEACDALVIPGGESTTMMKQMEFIDFFDAFRKFSTQKPVFGTCAGLILMSQKIIGDKMQPFQLLNVEVERNAFGRQSESFHTNIDLQIKPGHTRQIPAVFIRAPRIRHVGESVEILANFEGEPVLVRQGFHLGATFHPELTPDHTIHSYFLSLVTEHSKDK
ncbi:MAG TPA: pyridoxal 5'-phosphate synthase glutaminase subunit PdxT [Parachlamydiaceae bacterium]|nr:pyridoxal 5'-phosphate synthase glutaminase subunit PdxT [Parachlamydiaceae bacterium]